MTAATPNEAARDQARLSQIAMAQSKAEVLVEALPWLGRLRGATVVIKLGGQAMLDAGLRAAFAQDVVLLRQVGIRPVVVHGGGPQITAALDRIGVATVFAAGLRVTTPETMQVVRDVLVGEVNHDVVQMLNDVQGDLAVGLSGEDEGLFTAARRPAMVDGRAVDVGLVGDVVAVDPTAVLNLLDSGQIPVVATVSPDESGQLLNVNADTAAAALAVSLGAAKLVVLTDVAGLYADPADPATLRSEISVTEVESMLPSLSAGMAPKMEACARAVRGGVGATHVLDGRVPHVLLLEVFTDTGVGTMVTT